MIYFNEDTPETPETPEEETPEGVGEESGDSPDGTE
jgi:hypothetical protein